MEPNNGENGLEDATRKRLETLKNYAQEEIKYCDTQIKEKEKELADFVNLSKKIEVFPKKLQHRNEWIPICDVGFIKGTYVDTNRFQIMIGNGYFVEKSAHETIQFINRKLKNVQKIKEGFEKQKTLASSRLEFAQELFEQELIEIKDEYSEKKMKKSTLPMEPVTDNEAESIMEMLNKLELKEKQENEIEEIKEEPKSERYSKMAKGKSKFPKKPKGISQEDFENLLKQIDRLDTSDENSEDYDDEDFEEELSFEVDEENLDSDDSIEPKKIKNVHFSKELESGPSQSVNIKEEPKSILKNKNEKTFVNEEAIKEMNNVEKSRTILPQTDAFKGVFIEKNTHVLGPSTSAAMDTAEQSKKPVSRFKAQRMGLR